MTIHVAARNPQRAITHNTKSAPAGSSTGIDAAIAAGRAAGEMLAQTPLSPTQRALLEQLFAPKPRDLRHGGPRAA